jgi:hypothetical protein
VSSSVVSRWIRGFLNSSVLEQQVGQSLEEFAAQWVLATKHL